MGAASVRRIEGVVLIAQNSRGRGARTVRVLGDIEFAEDDDRFVS